MGRLMDCGCKARCVETDCILKGEEDVNEAERWDFRGEN